MVEAAVVPDLGAAVAVEDAPDDLLAVVVRHELFVGQLQGLVHPGHGGLVPDGEPVDVVVVADEELHLVGALAQVEHADGEGLQPVVDDVQLVGERLEGPPEEPASLEVIERRPDGVAFLCHILLSAVGRGRAPFFDSP